ncbi:hypothetical protein V9T40_005566 [Parthenolecanium corni]|uniref:Uncharacterized protein n=1 Tax=Parthenolecanium corni TaxID=536013 RepID=A0AAN9TST0_9HEMI
MGVKHDNNPANPTAAPNVTTPPYFLTPTAPNGAVMKPNQYATFKLLANYYQELFPVTFLLVPEQTNCLPGKASEQLPGIFRPVLAQDYQSW